MERKTVRVQRAVRPPFNSVPVRGVNMTPVPDFSDLVDAVGVTAVSQSLGERLQSHGNPMVDDIDQVSSQFCPY